jgi:DNA-binding CsgD family transcriptional regulator
MSLVESLTPFAARNTLYYFLSRKGSIVESAPNSPELAGFRLVKRLNEELHGSLDPHLLSLDMINEWLGRLGHGLPHSRLLQTLILRSPGILGLRAISIILLNESDTATNYSSHGYPAVATKLLDLYTTMEERLPSVDAMLTGKPVILSNRAEIEEYGVYLRAWVLYIPWLNSLMAFPLVNNGLVIGSVVWGFDENHEAEGWESKLFTALSMIVQSMVPNPTADFEPGIQSVMSEDGSSEPEEGPTILETKYRMTLRQVAVARMIADGASNREIAKALYFSESMARYETVKIYERLRVKNRAHAAGIIRSIL